MPLARPRSWISPSRPEVEAFVAKAAGDSAIDILVNNAGGVLGQVGRPLEEITPDEWQGIFDVNVTGAFYCARRWRRA